MTFYRVLDTETTGIPTDEDRQALVEVGRCDLSSALVVGDPEAMLVNPRRPIPPEAKAVHHITDEDVAGAPPIDRALIWLGEGAPTLYAAHNADFDRQFFGTRDTPIICTYKVALRFWPDLPSHGNQFLRYYLELPVDRVKADPPHRAGPDSYVTAHLLARIMVEATARGISTDRMLAWSKGPPLFHKVAFGKHRGMLWQDLPSDYLRWILDKSDMDDNTKANAKHWLKQRNER